VRAFQGTRWLGLLPFLAGIFLIGLYSHVLRPIWYDEMVYFVLGGLDSPAGLVQVLQETTSNVNQGQTGAYMALVYFSLKAFGASLISLRLVSILFSVVFLVTSLLFLRRKGLTWTWQLLYLVLLAGAATLNLFMSEARVYIALVAAVSSALLFYSYAPEERTRTVTVFGWVSILFLAIVHPYAAIYLPLIIVFSFLTRNDRKTNQGVSGLLRWANPALVVAAAVTYTVLAASTWLRGTAIFEGDPWEWIDAPLWLVLVDHLLMPFVTQTNTALLWLLVLVMAMAFILIRTPLTTVVNRLAGPILLLLVAFFASAVVSMISLFNDFWILPRQWVASIALAVVAMTWLLHELWVTVRLNSPSVALSFQLAVTAIALASVFSLTQFQLTKWIVTVRSYPEEIPVDFTRQDLSSRLDKGEVLSEKDWIRFAHTNTVEGGPVWPSFGEYYRARDWSDFVVVTDPGQLTIYD